MNRLIKAVIKYRRITLFLTVIVAVVGLGAYYLLPRQESPDVSVPIAMIITPYPGASPADVKDLVTKKVEDKLVELNGYDYCEGVSNESVSVVTVFFKSDADNDKAMQDVRNAVADIREDMPGGALTSIVNTDLVETAGIIISLSGKDYTYDQLESFGDRFKLALQNIPGISKAKVVGKLDREVQVRLDVGKLNGLRLSMEDVCRILAAQNVQIPSGSIDFQSGKLTVNTPGNYGSVDDIQDTIISVSTDNGVVTRLKDIADVKMDIEENAQKFKEEGNNAVLLTGYFTKNKNIVIIGQDVRKAIDTVKATLPESLIVNEVIYQPDSVSNSTNEFMFHLLMGIILVVVVVFLGMGMRNALVVSTSIPLSILMTFAVMYLTGIQIHQISLTALIISLGILVDNAIVVCDTVQVRLDQGEDILSAVYQGTARCTVPILSATAAIITAFLPLLGIPGEAGQFLSAIPLGLVISIIASYITAMLILPAMMAYTGKPEVHHHQRKERRVRRFFNRMLQISLKRKAVTVMGVLLALAVTIGGIMPQLQAQFFPYVEKDFFYIDITSEKAGDLNETEKLADQVEALLKKEPEVRNCTVSIGNGLPKFYITMSPPMPSDDYAQMVVKYDLKERKRFPSNVEFAGYVQGLLDKSISTGKCKVMLLENSNPTDAKVITRVTGDNLARMEQVSIALQREIAKIPGASNVRDNWNDSVYQLEVKVDQDKAASLGISKYDIQKEINLALYGNDASVFRKEGNEYAINVKSSINSAAALENFKIKSTLTGNKIPLKEIAVIGTGTKMNGINTYKRELAIDVWADPLPGYDASRIESRIETEILPKLDTSGTRISFAGEREDIASNFSVLGLLACVAVFAIYVILMIQFNSFAQPLVILTTIPLSLIGSVLGLYIFQQPLSMTALLGIIALIGLVVKNGILLIDYINEARARGIPMEAACADAVDKRFNAIILSALTVILALIPLAFSGSSLFAPMAVSLMAGLTVSTFLTMVVIPVIYCLIEGQIAGRGAKKEKAVI